MMAREILEDLRGLNCCRKDAAVFVANILPFFAETFPGKHFASPTFANDFTTIPYRFCNESSVLVRKISHDFLFNGSVRWNEIHSWVSRTNVTLEVYKKLHCMHSADRKIKSK